MPDQELPNLQAHDPQRANHLLTLEFGSRTQFDDPTLEYRRLFSELLGTFFLVLVSGYWSSYWVYVVGPLVGAAIAVACAMILRGRGGDPIAHAAGSGKLEQAQET